MTGAGGIRAWWTAWLDMARRVGTYQGEILVAIVYLVVVGPVWVVTRLTRARLVPCPPIGTSSWMRRRSDPRTLADLERPF